MAAETPQRKVPEPRESVIHWLLDSDPSIRWQVMRDLTGEPDEVIAAERARVAVEGWGSRLLDRQRPDGKWGDDIVAPLWQSTMCTLVLLKDMGLDPTSERARKAVSLVRERVTWRGWDWDGTWRGLDFDGTPFFAGEVEPCINGQVAASGAYFGQDVRRIVERLLGEQLADGGWNCEAEAGGRGSVRARRSTPRSASWRDSWRTRRRTARLPPGWPR